LKAAVKDVCKVYSHLEAMDRHLQDMFWSSGLRH
jgi:hypothetical protein